MGEALSLEKMIYAIQPSDLSFYQEAQHQLDQLTKPLGSLGQLEEIVKRIAAATRTLHPDIDKKAIIVMAADHGVASSGVSAYPPEVTVQMVQNFLDGGAAINVLCRWANAEFVIVDMGVREDIIHDRLLVKKVRNGTANFTEQPAMTKDEAVSSIVAGYSVAAGLLDKGYRFLGTGEMGIGNTTASSAIVSALLQVDPIHVTGRGTGLTDEALHRKVEVIREALQQYQLDQNDPLDVLAKVGGLEIAGLVGCYLAAAKYQAPIVIDGFISATAALVTKKLAPAASDYMIASHASEERGHQVVLKELGLHPILDMQMRLGEGTGAAMVFPLVDAGFRLLHEMATFAEAGVSEKSNEN